MNETKSRSMLFGEWVSGIRETLGLTQQEFAAELKKSVREVQRIEASKRKPRGALIDDLRELFLRKLHELKTQHGDLSPDELSPAQRSEWQKISERIDAIGENKSRLEAMDMPKPDDLVQLCYEMVDTLHTYFRFCSKALIKPKEAQTKG